MYLPPSVFLPLSQLSLRCPESRRLKTQPCSVTLQAEKPTCAVMHTENVARGANWEFSKCKGAKGIQCINLSKV